ncbi:MAG: thiamine-phosphate kinase [Alphaproteobacteria bacterium]|nr:thiamine-phosphate kinase [Alphaproteobacteria bacterium]
MDEFGLIATHLAPLAAPEGRGLLDDAATLPVRPGETLVVTADALVEGVHFLPADPPGEVARKLLRVNLSDLAAKGARPAHYLLTLALPRGVEESEIAAFAAGLAADQAAFGIALLGGDTVATSGPRLYAVTAFGWTRGPFLGRAGARVGDRVFVTGTIGDAGLGLKALTGSAGALSREAAAFAIGRYRRPEPRVGLGPALGGLASAALDISDGLAADAGHLAAVSGVRLRIEASAVPLSIAMEEALARGHMSMADIVSAGDDYEILLTAPPEAGARLSAAAEAAGVALTPIGRVEAGEGVVIENPGGRALVLERAGYRHF